MQYLFVITALLALVATPATGVAVAVTPVQKVLDLLEGMKAKGGQEKHDEMVRFAAFKQFCESGQSEKERLIEVASNAIQALKADIAKAESDEEVLGNEVAELDASLDGWAAEVKDATAERKSEQAEFTAADLDYSESVSALRRAIQTLKTRSADVRQAPEAEKAGVGEVLAQVAQLPRLPAEFQKIITSFLQTGTATGTFAPEANAYEFQSGGVVAMLEKLQLRFTDEQRALQKEEANRKYAFQMVMQQISDDKRYATDRRAAKAAAKAQRLQDAATAKKDLADTELAKDADETYMRDLLAECKQKSQDFASRQALRASELEAIQKAIDIISSPEVATAAENHLPSALIQGHGVQVSEARVLAQLRSGGDAADIARARQKATTLLKQKAKQANSALLTAIAARVSDDPFEKVKKMIQDLLTRLQEEASEEQSHKEWCDDELSSNKKTRYEKTSSVDSLTSRIDELNALAVKLAQQISDLAHDIKAIDGAVLEATAMRAEEKAKNAATTADAKGAQAAVAEATKILREFYAKAADSTSLAQRSKQTPTADSPNTWSEAYTGMQGAKGGVIGMLEVIQSDFARLQAETTASEDEAQREFEQFLKDSKMDSAMKDKEMRHHGYNKVRADRALAQAKEDLEDTQAELDTALAYFEKLKPSCINSGTSYAERKQRRQEEIVALQEALKILEGEDLSGSP